MGALLHYEYRNGALLFSNGEKLPLADYIQRFNVIKTPWQKSAAHEAARYLERHPHGRVCDLVALIGTICAAAKVAHRKEGAEDETSKKSKGHGSL